MKKILSVFAMMAMLFVACTPEDQPGTGGGNENEGGTGNEGGGGNTEQQDPELRITSKSDFDFAAEGGNGSVSYVIANPVEGVTVSAECEADWITDLTPGEMKTTFNVAAYENTEAPRSTRIVLSYGDAVNVEVNITQQPAVPEINPDAPDVEVNATVMYCDYYGGDPSVGYNYWLILADGEPTIDMSKNIYPAEYSNTYFIDIYTTEPVGDDVPVLPVGEYTSDDGSILLGEYTFYVKTKSKEDDIIPVAVSRMNVTVTDSKIEVLAAMASGEVHKVIYEGDLTLYMPKPIVSTFDGDYSYTSDKAAIIAMNYGDYYGVGMTNYMVNVYSDINALESGESELIMFEILSDNAETFAGTYDYCNVFELGEDDELFECFFPGEFEISEEGYIEFYSSWYLSLTDGGVDGKSCAPFKGGSVTFTEVEEGKFSCSLNALDDKGNTISSELTGMTLIYNEEGKVIYPSDTASPSKRMRAGYGKKNSKILPVQASKLGKMSFAR